MDERYDLMKWKYDPMEERYDPMNGSTIQWNTDKIQWNARGNQIAFLSRMLLHKRSLTVQYSVGDDLAKFTEDYYYKQFHVASSKCTSQLQCYRQKHTV